MTLDPTLPTSIRTAPAGWKDVALDMVEGTKRAAMRFPLTAVLLLVLSLDVNLEVGGWLWIDFIDDHAVFALSGAILASLSLELALESWAVGASIRLMGAALAAATAFVLLYWDDATVLYHPALFAGLMGFVLVAPYIGRGSSAAFWLFVVRGLFAGLLATLALLLFGGGISAILASLTYLFGIDVPEELYGHVWATAGLFAAPLFGLGQLPRDFDETTDGETPIHVTRSMQALGDYVAAPLLIVYAVLLHAYAAMIFVSGEWPEGQVGWLVLAFGFCLFAALMVIHPFLTIARPPTRLLITRWPLALPVPLILLFLAAAERIEAYGLTPERYLLVLFGVVTAIVTLAQLSRRFRGDIRLMALLPVAALLIASFGPQGALSASIRSQEERFRALVEAPEITPEVNAEALAVLDYLEGAEALDRVQPETLPSEEEAGYGLNRRIAVAYGLDPALRGGESDDFYRSFPGATVVGIAGFDVMLPAVTLDAPRGESRAFTQSRVLPDGRTIALSLAENGIAVESGGETTVFVLPVEAFRQTQPVETDVVLTLESDGRTLLVMPLHVSGSERSPARLRSFTGTIALRTSDW